MVKTKRHKKAKTKRRIRVPKLKKMNSSIRQDLFNLPNMLTFLRIAVIPPVILLLMYETPLSCLIAVILFGLASATDYVDGYLARKLGLVSMTGKFLDPLADKLMVMSSLVALASMHWVPVWIVIVLLAREFIVQGLRQIASAEGLVIAAADGGKMKTALQMLGLIALMKHYSYPLFFAPDLLINFYVIGIWLIGISLFFSLKSAGQYFANFLRAIGELD